MNALFAGGIAIACCAASLAAQSTADTTHATHEALGDAWWTGPMLAASANTLPPGHLLFEPYFYDIVSPPHTNGFGSRAYIIYGLLPRLSVGVIPIFGYNKMNLGPSSSGIGFGDFTAQAQYRLTTFHPGSAVPTISVLLQETFPTGDYDHLTRLSDGFGAGSYTTSLGLYAQTFFWMPNGRILRMRLDLSQQLYSTNAHIADVSVYGTGPGFAGLAMPGLSSNADLAAEYSLTQNWVLALDAVYYWNADTRVLGGGNVLHSGSSYQFGFAPGVEYNLNSSLGLLFAARILEIGHNAAPSVAPAIAINFVH